MRGHRTLGAVVAVIGVVVTIAAVGAWREATAHGWIADGYPRLVADAFWHRFDRTAPIGLGALLVLLVGAAALRGWVPSRREMALPIALVGLVAIARVVTWGNAQICPRRPNVLLVSIDTLRADRLGAYGYGRETSPVLDRRLAAEGVVFEQVWSQSPKTTPSHMTMLTSLYPSVHGITLWERGTAPVLNPRVHTLAEVLKSEGYATAAFTAGAHMHRERGFLQGFDVYKHGDQLRRALTWLDAHGRRPFFLFFHTYEVHDPYAPPAELVGRFATDPVPRIVDAVTRIRAGSRGWEKAHKIFWDAVDPASARDVAFVSDLYDAGVAKMDGGTLPALLDRLDALGLTDDTLVVFTSDHGEAFHEHGVFLHDDLYGETLRVPLVLRFPRRLRAGWHVADPVRLVDLMPTMLDLLGLQIPKQVQGTSFAPLARGEEGAIGPDTAISEYGDPVRARTFESVRTGTHTLIRDDGALRFYDRTTDPGELRDVAGTDPARVAALAAVLDAWHTDCARLALVLGPRSTDAAAPSQETVRQLRALGYVD